MDIFLPGLVVVEIASEISETAGSFEYVILVILKESGAGPQV